MNQAEILAQAEKCGARVDETDYDGTETHIVAFFGSELTAFVAALSGVPPHLQSLLKTWADRAQSALPADAMIVNRLIRELREVITSTAPIAAPTVALPAEPVEITLDFKQATDLLEMFGGEPSTVTLIPGDGHSGKGLYAYWSDMPEEGAMYLGVTDDEAAPTAQAERPEPAEQARDATRTDLVPGVMRCAKCEFQLVRVTLAMDLGKAIAGNSDTEPCPNGCGLLWPVTWEQYARQMQDAAETMAERAIAAERQLAALSQPVAPAPKDAAELTALVERLKQEAQIHAGEARAANATIAEIYQLCTGATGEPGNWHGSEPVHCRIAELEKDRDEWKEATESANERFKIAERKLAELEAKAQPVTAPAGMPEPMFLVRLLGDGMYEGPVHNRSVGGKMLREEKPGEWTPLYTIDMVQSMLAQGLAPGWQAVPVEPTCEWVAAFEPIPEYQDAATQTIREILASAPRPPAAPGGPANIKETI